MGVEPYLARLCPNAAKRPFHWFRAVRVAARAADRNGWSPEWTVDHAEGGSAMGGIAGPRGLSPPNGCPGHGGQARATLAIVFMSSVLPFETTCEVASKWEKGGHADCRLPPVTTSLWKGSVQHRAASNCPVRLPSSITEGPPSPPPP